MSRCFLARGVLPLRLQSCCSQLRGLLALSLQSRRFDAVEFLTRYGTLIALALLLLFNIIFTRNFVTLQTLNVNLTRPKSNDGAKPAPKSAARR